MKLSTSNHLQILQKLCLNCIFKNPVIWEFSASQHKPAVRPKKENHQEIETETQPHLFYLKFEMSLQIFLTVLFTELYT